MIWTLTPPSGLGSTILCSIGFSIPNSATAASFITYAVSSDPNSLEKLLPANSSIPSVSM